MSALLQWWSLQKVIKEKSNFLVIGLGRFGSNVARELYENGHDVLAIDNDMSAVQHIIDAKYVSNAMQCDAIDAAALRKLEIEKFAAVILAIGTNIEDSVLIAANLKELTANKVIAKASTSLHGRILEKIGVDIVVYPEAEMGKTVARQLLGMNFLEKFALSENFSIAEIPLPERYAGEQLAKTDIRSDYHLNVLAIRRAGGHFNVSPTPKTSLQKDDSILVLGSHENIDNFRSSVSTETNA